MKTRLPFSRSAWVTTLATLLLLFAACHPPAPRDPTKPIEPTPKPNASP